MEIVRAQPFFSKNARILRDQLDEYVQGFPATKAHRKIIANKYKIDYLQQNSGSQEFDQANQSFGGDEGPQQQSQQKREMNMTGGMKITLPDKELPVDTHRLKKAIKIALLKNDNDPEKIDLSSIMREQVRIHKHIKEFKQEKQKSKVSGEAGSYFSSRIVKKIAEDHIHKSLKQIQADNMSLTGEFLDKSKQKALNQSHDGRGQKQTKFQKLLASKFNQDFKSVLVKKQQESSSFMGKRVLTQKTPEQVLNRKVIESGEYQDHVTPAQIGTIQASLV